MGPRRKFVTLQYADCVGCVEIKEAQWPIGYGVGLRIKRSSVRIRPWPLCWVLGQGSLLPLSQGEAFTLASISYLAILAKYILAKKIRSSSSSSEAVRVFGNYFTPCLGISWFYVWPLLHHLVYCEFSLERFSLCLGWKMGRTAWEWLFPLQFRKYVLSGGFLSVAWPWQFSLPFL